MQPLLHIVIPVKNESMNVEELYFRIRRALERDFGEWSILFVDDASTDDTFRIIRGLCRQDDRIRSIRLAESVGQERAVLTGIKHCPESALIVMDGDLQDPPELLPDMIRLWKRGYDTVLTRRASRRGEGLVKRITARLFYGLIRAMGGESAEGNFFLVGERAMKSIREIVDPFPLLRLRVPGLGSRITTLRYDRQARHEGRSKYNFSRMWSLAMDGITASTRLPLGIGYGLVLACFLLAAAAMLAGLLAPGLESTGRIVLFGAAAFFMVLSALCLFFSLLGEHLVRLSTLVRSPPPVVVEETINLEREPAAIPKSG